MKKTVPSSNRQDSKIKHEPKLKIEVVKNLRPKSPKPSLISTIRCT